MNNSLLAPRQRLPKSLWRNHHLLHLLMLIVAFCWAANIVAGKVVLRSMSPLALAQFRVSASAAAFAILLLGSKRWSGLHLAPSEWGYFAKAALFGITLNQIFFINGIERTSAAHAGLIVALGPVMVLVLACTMRLEPLTVPKSVGTAVAFVGVVLLTAGKNVTGSGATLFGDAVMFGSTLVFAYYTILLKEIADRYDALALNAVVFCAGALLMLPFSAHAVVNVHWTALPARAWASLAFMVGLGTVLSYLVFAVALTGLTAARVAAFAYLQPVVAISLGVWLLSETLTLMVVVGGSLILLGVYLTEHEPQEEKVAND